MPLLWLLTLMAATLGTPVGLVLYLIGRLTKGNPQLRKAGFIMLLICVPCSILFIYFSIVNP